MNKIRLEPDALEVESFQVMPPRDPRGTVVGRSGTDATDCWGLCGQVETTEWLGCTDVSDVRDGCVYPTAAHHSCQPGETVNQETCNCLFPDTDVRMCCTAAYCSGMC